MNPCNCGSEKLYLELRGNNVGVYCQSCHKWQTWLGKQKVAELKNRGFKVYSQGANPFKQASEEFNNDKQEKPLSEIVIPCGACGNIELVYAKKGNNIGSYCKKCLKWKRWISKTDVKSLLARGVKIYTWESLQPVSNYEHSSDMQEEYMDNAVLSFEEENVATTTDKVYKQDYLSNAEKFTHVEDELPEEFETGINSIRVEDEDGLTEYERQVQQEYEKHDSKSKSIDCLTCTTGVLDILGDKSLISLGFNAESKTIIICNPIGTKVYGHTDVNFCPTCGREL